MATHTISNKATRDLIKYALSLGFQWNGKLSGGGHVKLTHPGGGSVTLAVTTRGPNKAALSTIKREARRSGVSID